MKYNEKPPECITDSHFNMFLIDFLVAVFTMYWVRKYSWERLSHWLLSSQLSSISSLGTKTARVTFPEHTALWENSGRGSLGLNTNTENTEKMLKSRNTMTRIDVFHKKPMNDLVMFQDILFFVITEREQVL